MSLADLMRKRIERNWPAGEPPMTHNQAKDEAMSNSIIGWYYLHTNGSLIYKPSPDAIVDIRDSDFARGAWSCIPSDREKAWATLVEAQAAGANLGRIHELAEKWGCDNRDAAVYAAREGALLSRDGPAWCATRKDFENLQESPAGFGATCLDALAALCKELGYRPTKMWPRTFRDLLAAPAHQGSTQ